MEKLEKRDKIEKISHSLKDTERIAKEFSNNLNQGDIVALYGPLGSSKTFFVKEVAKSLGVKNYITSPSFTILNEYNASLPIYHFDFYRLKNEKEIEEIGFSDFLNRKGVFFIEWPEKIEHILPNEYIKIVFEIIDKDSRKITILTVRNTKHVK